ncbi:hypothetical protein AB205_0152100 [Aquarana catesbeiana]|uniref:Uncharacterized protein n=1 Tax=Aquarana catesbeiana TaxID=8400 RepID=A0A2G9SL93_AQUCT|nr:hypothetical protein AB205_0152100 [Aquarana catesbeiana]
MMSTYKEISSITLIKGMPAVLKFQANCNINMGSRTRLYFFLNYVLRFSYFQYKSLNKENRLQLTFLYMVHFLWFQIYYFCFLIILIRCIFCSCVGYFPFLLLGVAKITQSLQICDPLLFLAKKYRDLDHMDFFFFHGALGEANSPEEQRLVTSLLG